MTETEGSAGTMPLSGHDAAKREEAGPLGAITVEVVRTEEGLDSLAPEWRRLYGECKPRNPFLSYEWTRACWAQARPSATPFLVACRIGSRLAGVAPLLLDRKGPFRVLRFIGDRHSDYLGFLSAQDHARIAGSLLAHLEREGGWDLAFLRPLSDAHPHPYPAKAAGLSAEEVEGAPAPYLTLQRDWEELAASGPPQLRHVRRWVRKFEREGGTIERLKGTEVAFEEVLAIEAKSWKAAQGVSWAGSPVKRRLLRSALETVGELEVWLARAEARPVAYLMNFVTPERAMFYQGSYDQAYRKSYPGGVLHHAAIRAACAAGLREYDFLLGGEEYKNGWTTGVHRQRHLALVPDTLRGRAAFAAVVAPRWFFRRFETAHAVRAFAVRQVAAFRRAQNGVTQVVR